jgi:hypothetical protein
MRVQLWPHSRGLQLFPRVRRGTRRSHEQVDRGPDEQDRQRGGDLTRPLETKAPTVEPVVET